MQRKIRVPLFFLVTFSIFCTSYLVREYYASNYYLLGKFNCNFTHSYLIHFINFVVLGLVFYFLRKLVFSTYSYTILMSMLLGSAVSITFERLIAGCVFDYYNFGSKFYFNLPDVFILISILTLGYLLSIKPIMSNFIKWALKKS